jgi:hypothetical protein
MNIHSRVLIDFTPDFRTHSQDNAFQNLRVQPYTDVRIRGLSILNPEPGCAVSGFMIENEAMTQNQEFIPAAYFAHPNAKSIAELKNMIRECPELLPITSWIGNKVITVGHNIVLTIRGKFEAAVAWGDTVTRANPMHDIKVETCTLEGGHKGVKAELKIRRWDDEPLETVMSVYTLSEPGALTLIQTELQKYKRYLE